MSDIRFWTDSQIVLAWLNAPLRQWNVFVSNRVAEIQNLTAAEKWNHVKGTDNPADIVSRGYSPDQLINSEL